jgi:hypothetical protein
VHGVEFLQVLERLIGATEATRCARKICLVEQLDEIFLGRIVNFEAVAFYVYATANGWHSAINAELWTGRPSSDVAAFAEVLNTALDKIPPIGRAAATVYRGYLTDDLSFFDASYAIDGVVSFPGFTSASFSQTGAFGGNVLFIIRASSARAIWWLSPNFHEEEALLPTDCHFRVVDKQTETIGSGPSRLVIVLQEITQRA